MPQKIFGLALGGSGIVAVLIVGGIFLKVFVPSSAIGDVAIWSGVGIGIALGLLGIFGVVISLLKRIM